VYDQVNVYLVILILIFNDFSHSVLLKFQIAYGIEAGFFFIILLLLHVKAIKISVDLWKTAIKIMNSDNSLCDFRETMGIPQNSENKPLQI